MPITSTTTEPGIVSVTVDYPPVNAIPSRAGSIADTITKAGKDPNHVVILRAEGRGFNAGVDIKEMQNTEGFTALIDANRAASRRSARSMNARYRWSPPSTASASAVASAWSATPT